MPCLHAPVVATRVPSMSMVAASKKARGCSAQTRSRVSLMTSSRVSMWSRREAAAEVAGGGGVGDAAGAQGVEEDLVVAAQFDVLEAGAVAQGVVGDVEDVVGLVVGQVELEQVQALVDGVDEAELAGQGVDGADAAVGDAAGAVGDLVVDVGGGEHGSGAAAEVGFVEAAFDAALAVGQPPSYDGIHSKSLVGPGVRERVHLLKPRKTPRDFEFFANFPPAGPRRTMLVQGLASHRHDGKRVWELSLQEPVDLVSPPGLRRRLKKPSRSREAYIQRREVHERELRKYGQLAEKRAFTSLSKTFQSPKFSCLWRDGFLDSEKLDIRKQGIICDIDIWNNEEEQAEAFFEVKA